MKKILCLFLCVVTMVFVFVSCEKICEHEFENGVCKECDEACVHVFANGSCTVCTKACEHEYVNGTCSVCQFVCTHNYEKGICNACGAKNLTKEVLAGRTFKYAFFEISWSENATDTEKEILRKQYNTDDDEELFDEIHDDLRSALDFASSLSGAFGGQTLSKKQVFFDEYGWAYLDGKTSNGWSASIKDNKIVIGDDTFYYEKDRIYNIGDSEDFKGIAIKTVYVESESKS